MDAGPRAWPGVEPRRHPQPAARPRGRTCTRRAVDILVSRLRRKLEPLQCIKTLRSAATPSPRRAWHDVHTIPDAVRRPRRTLAPPALPGTRCRAPGWSACSCCWPSAPRWCSWPARGRLSPPAGASGCGHWWPTISTAWRPEIGDPRRWRRAQSLASRPPVLVVIDGPWCSGDHGCLGPARMAATTARTIRPCARWWCVAPAMAIRSLRPGRLAGGRRTPALVGGLTLAGLLVLTGWPTAPVAPAVPSAGRHPRRCPALRNRRVRPAHPGATSRRAGRPGPAGQCHGRGPAAHAGGASALAAAVDQP